MTIFYFIQKLVLILPMRNGNYPHIYNCPDSVIGSYPTYEEWKHLYFFPIFCQHIYVLILPMRNGNTDQHQTPMHLYQVLILPMRNGNIKEIEKDDEATKEFLSYL